MAAIPMVVAVKRNAKGDVVAVKKGIANTDNTWMPGQREHPRRAAARARTHARTHQVYFAPATPCELLVAHSDVERRLRQS